ncbi:hypothetical protein [Rubripirellula amarantea]|uniref:hypothetical protein n=1 Tax=Rubripirellula amarantea TaxID=2527999 RepID=UPI0011B4881D|nr:hypothetical protein [Rubripirellula amarantea]
MSAAPPDETGIQSQGGAVDREFKLNNAELTESSGLAFSNLAPGYLWSHNDSGSRAHLFAFGETGNAVGSIRFSDQVAANDWEDMASFVDGGVPRLLVADCGDNQANRNSVSLYIFDEPDPTMVSRVTDFQVVKIRYPSGPRDCEAVAVDVTHREIILFTKSFLPLSDVFVVALPPRDQKQIAVIDARRVTSVAIPLVTGADFDPVTGNLWLCNYFQCYRYEPSLQESEIRLLDTVRNVPYPVSLPAWKQIEAIAVDRKGRAWVTSEGNRTPLGRLSCLKLSKSSTLKIAPP